MAVLRSDTRRTFWLQGPPGLDSRALARRVAEHGILIEPGESLFMAACPPRNHFRLGFSSIPVERIEPGIARLAELIRPVIAR